MKKRINLRIQNIHNMKNIKYSKWFENSKYKKRINLKWFENSKYKKRINLRIQNIHNMKNLKYS